MDDPAWMEFQKRLSLLMDSFYALSPENKPQAISSVRESICQMQLAVKQQLCSDAMRTVAAMAESLIQETYGIQPINKSIPAVDYFDNSTCSPHSVYTQLDQSTTDSNDILTSALYESLKAVSTDQEYGLPIRCTTTPIASSYPDIINLHESHNHLEESVIDKSTPPAPPPPPPPPPVLNFCNVQENENGWTNSSSSTMVAGDNEQQSSPAVNHFETNKNIVNVNLHTNANALTGCQALDKKPATATVEESGFLSCTVCSFKTKHRQNLHRHLKLHQSIKDDRRFACNKCDKKFKTGSSLKEHEIYIHSNDKTLKCSQCEKSFATQKDMNRHLKSHSDERAFVCHCGKSYKSKYHLNRHDLSSHCKK